MPTDTPSDSLWKRGVEDTSHFLLFCPFCITHRETLIARVYEILRKNNMDFIGNTELYLYGHHSMNNLDNQKILAAAIKFIKRINRFSTLILPPFPPPPLAFYYYYFLFFYMLACLVLIFLFFQ